MTRGALQHAFENADSPFALPRQGPNQNSAYLQLVSDTGQRLITATELCEGPDRARTRLPSRRKSTRDFFTNGKVGGKECRIYTVYVGQAVAGNGVALQLVRPTGDIAHTLGRLRLILLLVVAAGSQRARPAARSCRVRHSSRFAA